MGRRQFSWEFKLEAVRLVTERGVSVVQASWDLDVGETILRRWIKELTADAGQAFPGQGQVKPEQQEIDRLRREVAKLKAERDIPEKPWPTSRGSGCEVRLRRETSRNLAGAVAAQLVADALMMAIRRRGKPDALLHGSDQGSRCSSGSFQKLRADHGVTCSMSRSGNLWDKAAMESFSSLKTERTACRLYRTRDQARADMFDYTERFYSPRRRHSTTGYLSPMKFERIKASA